MWGNEATVFLEPEGEVSNRPPTFLGPVRPSPSIPYSNPLLTNPGPKALQLEGGPLPTKITFPSGDPGPLSTFATILSSWILLPGLNLAMDKILPWGLS